MRKALDEAKIPQLVCDEPRGEWAFVETDKNGSKRTSLGWNPSFVRDGDAVLATGVVRRPAGQDSDKLINVPVETMIPSNAVVRHRRPERGPSVVSLPCDGQILDHVLVNPDVIYGSALQPI